jgi:hypothetical protein
MDQWGERNQEILDNAESLEASLVELVVAVSECSEDESEIFDRMDVLLESGRIRILPHGGPEPLYA